MKQTSAVEFVKKQLDLGLSENGLKSVITKAKEMEKQQIIEARINGHNAPSSTLKHFDAEQYYNETFNK
jgi:capsular polysaccharide biosynthesis protein